MARYAKVVQIMKSMHAGNAAAWSSLQQFGDDIRAQGDMHNSLSQDPIPRMHSMHSDISSCRGKHGGGTGREDLGTSQGEGTRSRNKQNRPFTKTEEIIYRCNVCVHLNFFVFLKIVFLNSSARIWIYTT